VEADRSNDSVLNVLPLLRGCTERRSPGRERLGSDLAHAANVTETSPEANSQETLPVSLPVSPGKVRSECQESPAPTPDSPMNTGRLS